MSSIKVTQIAPRHLRGTTFIGQDGSTTHFHPHSRVILHEYATKEWIIEMLGELSGADLSELVTKKYAHATFGEIFLGKDEPIGVKVTDLWFDTTKEDQHLKMCSQLDRDDDDNVIKQHWMHVAPRPSVDDDVQKLKEDVVALEGEIEALITLDEKGSWESTLTDDVKSGQVYFSTSDFTSKEITVKISKTDKDSNAHMFANVGFGTWIEFVEDDADYCLGQVALLDNENDEYFEATLNVSVGKGIVVDESNIKIRAFEAGEEFDPDSIRIVDINDKPPVEPKEGDLWFDNNSSDMTLRVFHKDSEAWLAAAPATTVEDRVAKGEQLQTQIKNDVSNLQADFEALSNSIGSQETPLLWKYNSQVTAENLGNGEFNLSASPSNGSADEWSIHFAERDARGERWFPHDSGNPYSHAVDAQFATIRDRDSIVCHGKTKKWYFNEGNNNHVKLVLTYYRNQFPMANGKYYLVTIPGYMPFFPYSSDSYSNGTH